MKQSIDVVTRLQDGGDGGYTMYAYNNNEELLADHPNARDFRQGPDGKYADFPKELTQKEKDDILNEDDPYKNGYIGTDTIEIEIDESGKAKLAKPLHFHAGQ